MLELGRISLTVFAYVTEENQRVVKALKQCLPLELRTEPITKINTQSQFNDRLTIYSFETDNEDHIGLIIEHLNESIDAKGKDYLKRNLSKKIDMDERTLHIRFDKFKAYNEELFVSEGNDVIKVEIGYFAYTNDQNSMDNITETFEEYGLIG